VFLFTLCLDIVIIIALHWLQGEWYGKEGERFDTPGSVIYALMIVSAITVFTLLPSVLGIVLSVASIGGLLGFILRETRVAVPVLDVKLFRHNIVFAFSNLAALINYMATFAVTFLLSLYLQQILGFGPAVAGVILIAQPVVMAIVSPLAGRFSDKIEPRIVSSAGMALTAVALAILAFVTEKTSLGLIVGSLVILGLGFGLFTSPNTNAVMSSVERRIYGSASATLGTMRLVGQTFSLGITTLVFSVIIGSISNPSPAYPPLFLSSMSFLFVTFAVLCAFGVIASLARGNVRGNTTEIPQADSIPAGE
jgi:predicted MFS family arabinose efflux permease